MPTPALNRIPIIIEKTEWLSPYLNDPPVFLPAGIEPGQSAYVEGSIRAFIRYVPSEMKASKEPFRFETTVRIIATMPGLNRVLPAFDIQKSIIIQYPIEMNGSNYLK